MTGRDPHEERRSATNLELFFDLVFVFAVTQLSHTLLHHFTPLGAVQVTLLFLAVWWVWVYTTWVTNWLNPDLTPVRLLLFVLMLGGLLLSTSIPTAWCSSTRPGRRPTWPALMAAPPVANACGWASRTAIGRPPPSSPP